MMEKTEMKGEAFKGTKLLSLPLIIKRTNTAIFFFQFACTLELNSPENQNSQPAEALIC